MDVHLIGDLVMLTPLFQNLRELFPHSKITLLAGPWAGSVFKNFDEIDNFEVIEVPWVKYDKKFQRYYTLFQKAFYLRKVNFDMSIEVRGDIRSQLFLRLCGCKNIVSYSFFDIPYFVDQVVPINTDLKHLISYNQNIINFLTDYSSGLFFKPFLKISSLETESVKNVSSYIGIHFGASLPMRRPNLDLLRLWIDQIANLHPSSLIVIFDTPEDPTLCYKLIELFSEFNVNASVWKGGLREFIVHMTKCQYLYCLDSAPAHIAAALSIPSTVIYGPSIASITHPISDFSTILESPHLDCKVDCNQVQCINEDYQKCYSSIIC
jgi:heptosyltransferase-2